MLTSAAASSRASRVGPAQSWDCAEVSFGASTVFRASHEMAWPGSGLTPSVRLASLLPLALHMKNSFAARILPVIALIALATALPDAAKIKVRAQGDKTFDFTTVHTWDWDHPTPGKVIALRTQDDDPEALRKRFESTVMEAFDSQFQVRGLARAIPPDVKVTYYLIVKFNSSAHEMGQFLPATPYWGLPAFAPATQSLKVVQEGSLVLDVVAPSKESVVWRAIAETEIDPSKTDDERKERIREAARKMLEKFPRPR